MMIDFTDCPVNKFIAYGGANGNKINISFQGKSYMLKFPPVPSRNKAMSYTNGCISEYLACHMFEVLGFNTQETLLGKYTDPTRFCSSLNRAPVRPLPPTTLLSRSASIGTGLPVRR